MKHKNIKKKVLVTSLIIGAVVGLVVLFAMLRKED